MALLVEQIVAVVKAISVEHGQTGGSQHLLSGHFVHAKGGGGHVAAHIGQAQRLKEALERPVLRVGAVHDGKGEVEAHEVVAAKLFWRCAHGPNLGLVAAHDGGLRTLGEQCRNVAVVFNLEQRLAGVEHPLLGGVKGRNLIFFSVERVHGLHCGDDRDLVLGRASAKKYANRQFHSSLPPYIVV